MTFLEDMIGRVRDYDASRPRSNQVAVGWSELGGCRAYLGYRLDGAWATDEPDGWGAIRGTAIHAFMETVLDGLPGLRSEVDTEYRGIPGHADLVVIDDDSVNDWKSTKLVNSRLWASDPAVMWEKRVQVHGYAAGLVKAGELPEKCTVRLVVIPVDGTFADWWMLEERFDRSIADWGADRLAEVEKARAEGQLLPKDKPYGWCLNWCPFASACRAQDDPLAVEEITDPELAAAIARYGETAQRITRLGKDKDGLAAMIRGLRGTAGDWRVSLSKPGEPKYALDEEWVRADYAARGEDVPVVEKPGNAPRLTVTRIRKKAEAKP